VSLGVASILYQQKNINYFPDETSSKAVKHTRINILGSLTIAILEGNENIIKCFFFLTMYPYLLFVKANRYIVKKCSLLLCFCLLV
jgi:hypothetical protein